MEQSAVNQKVSYLDKHTIRHDSGCLTTNQGVGIPDADNSLKAGTRGPTVMEDFIFREKITHFDHERIPERIVHARGSGAHGVFQVYAGLQHLTKAHFLSDPKLVTPVFVRFSTVAGFRGSPDTVRDLRGFAVKFYTDEGNYDIVGNNVPVFFIQDAMKFPDLIHAVKPEPNNEMPQAASAHDTFWDFVVNTPETMHCVMWLMSPRAVPQNYRMMEGFGIHTFRLVDASGGFRYVKFHWKPLLGMHSLVWDEAQQLAGKDPDFHRRDLWESLANGAPAEYELGIQVLEPKDEFTHNFDILDPTKLWPEELIPVQKVGKMTLNQNVSNFFAETEQIAFCPANIVPGIDFTNDPLLQGRLFSYLDTQISRLGGPNFQQIPINRPLAKVRNNQRDGMHRMTIDEGQTSYSPNALSKGEPHTAKEGESRFEHYQEKVSGQIIRQRSESFSDYYTQSALFWNSMSAWERKHIIDAFQFELGKCQNKVTRQKLVDMLGNVNPELAAQVAQGLGATPPGTPPSPVSAASPALSMDHTVKTPKTRRVAVLVEPGFDKAQFDAVTGALTTAGAAFDVISGKLGMISSASNQQVECKKTYTLSAPVFYDGVYVPGGSHVAAVQQSADAMDYLSEISKHFKTVGLTGEAAALAPAAKLPVGDGILTNENPGDMKQIAQEFLAALTAGRHYGRHPNQR
jgi:catalase